MNKWDTGVALVRQNQGIRFATKEDWTRDIGLGAVITDRFAAGWRFGFRSRGGLAGGEGGGSHGCLQSIRGQMERQWICQVRPIRALRP